MCAPHILSSLKYHSSISALRNIFDHELTALNTQLSGLMHHWNNCLIHGAKQLYSHLKPAQTWFGVKNFNGRVNVSNLQKLWEDRRSFAEIIALKNLFVLCLFFSHCLRYTRRSNLGKCFISKSWFIRSHLCNSRYKSDFALLKLSKNTMRLHRLHTLAMTSVYLTI